MNYKFEKRPSYPDCVIIPLQGIFGQEYRERMTKPKQTVPNEINIMG